MKKKLITTIIFSISLCLYITSIKAQDGNVINFMQTVPQSNYNNPAAIPSVGFYLGIPVVSTINIGLDNGSFSYNNIFSRRNQPSPYDSIYIDVDKFLGSIKGSNKLSYDISSQLFGLGFKVKRSYFTFSINSKNTINANFTKDFMTFLLKGNDAFIGKNANIGDFKFGMNSYLEASFGFTREINKRLSVGVKFKYLIGLVNIYTERSNINLYTDPNTYALTATSDLLIRTSSPFDSLTNIKTKDAKWADMKQNKGIAFDFGGEYRLTNKWSFGLSVVDLGYIDWTNNVKVYQSKNPNAPFNFSGIDINTAFKDGKLDTTAINNLVDSLKNSMGIENVKGSKYRAPLKTKIYLTASYFLTKRDRFGFVMRNDIVNQAVNTSLTLSYNRYVGKNVALTFANTFVSGNALNPGGGITFNLAFIQFYFLVDHSSSFYLADVKNFNFQFGINLVTGKTKPGERFTEPIKKDDYEGKSKKNKIIVEPEAIDSTLLKTPVVIPPKQETPVIKTDSLKTKAEANKFVVDTLKTHPDTLKTLKTMDTTFKNMNDTLRNGLINVDTTIKKLSLPLDSLKTNKNQDTIPANKPEGNVPPVNQNPTNNPINNDANKNTPALVPNEVTPPKQN